jgi:hypothetical protein
MFATGRKILPGENKEMNREQLSKIFVNLK